MPLAAWDHSSSSGSGTAGSRDTTYSDSTVSADARQGDSDDWLTDDEWGMPAYSGPHSTCRPLQIQVTPIAWQPTGPSGPPRPSESVGNSCASASYSAMRGGAFGPIDINGRAGGASHSGVSQGYWCEDQRPPTSEYVAVNCQPVLCGYEYSPAGPMERLRPMYYQDINPMDRAPTLEMRSLRPPSEQDSLHRPASEIPPDSQRLHQWASRRAITNMSAFLRYAGRTPRDTPPDSPLAGDDSDSGPDGDYSEMDDPYPHDHAFYGADSEDDLESDSDVEGNMLPADELMPKTLCGPDSSAFCSICLEACTEGQHVRTLLSCGHQFHSDCVEKWLVRREWCPNCRQHVDQNRKTASTRVHPWPLSPLRMRGLAGLDPPNVPISRPLPFHHSLA
mmetsp:Transcript_16875/g.39240  ORF Transcript_16875/g.39240 Transcript_16875/m.39240 type:complete len:392 (-) Transcript_16875:235-1410(-)